MVLKVGSRGHIPAFMVMEVMRAAAEREQRDEAVFHLEVGQPGTPAPRGVIAAAHKALDSDRLGYTTALGLPDLRAAIAGHYKDSYGVTVLASQVVVTTGSSCGFILSFLSAFNPGDRVALAEPGYPCYRHILNALGITPVMLPAGPAERFQPTPALIEKAMAEGPLDGLIVASPSNPTGTMLDRGGMEALLTCCRDNGIRVVSDEIYQGISFGMEPVTAAELEPTAIVVNSFSKYFCMTGWRLGWLIVPPDLLRAVECL
ncbi:MAG: aminotransferase class I/II-fold pyridoxal phosphate-dependent enzyme, partial [Alphaproteobacteria bacterium]|nr:aminotransferase class I/II-fold pyridoxal phosphate-dependent enzyme [Alphaproteobacteria bacterium]